MDSLITLLSLRRVNGVRMFCDISDLFDLHETEDCPIQVDPSNLSLPTITLLNISGDSNGGAEPHQEGRPEGSGEGVLRDLRDIRTQHRGVQRRRDLLDTFHLHCKHKCLICNVIFHDTNNFTHARHMYCI